MSAGQRWWWSEPPRRKSRAGVAACEVSCRPADFEEDAGLDGLDDCEKTHGRDRESGKRRRRKRRRGGEEDQNSAIKQRTVGGGGCSLGCSRPWSPRMGIATTRGVIRLILAATILGLLAWPCEGQTEITALSPINGPPTGAYRVTLTGTLLGPADYSTGVKVGGTPCESTQWVSPSSIICKVPRGIMLSATITATVVRLSGGNEQGFWFDPVPKFSYDEARITRLEAKNGPASGRQNLTITGSNFGSFSFSVANALGGTNCEASDWSSNTAVTCKNSPSILRGRNVIVSLALGRDTLTGAFTYDKFIAQSVFPMNSRTFGHGTLTVTGFGFGTVDFTPAVSMRTYWIPGGTACLASRWMSDTTVLCKLPSDTSSDVNVVVTLDRHIKTLQRVFSYDNPLVTSTVPANVPHDGGTVVTITGFNFGASAYNPRAARLGDTACTNTEWQSDTSMSCMSQRGNSNLLPTIVSVALVKDDKLAFSYNNPILQGLSPSNGPASGLTRITLHGDSFGPFDLTPLLRIGKTKCPQTQWLSSTAVVCKLASVPYEQWFTGSTEDVYIQIGKTRTTWQQSFTYDAACVGPCVVQIACDTSVKGEGCGGSTQGDYRHTSNKYANEIDQYFGSSRIRLMGNFSVSTGGPVVVGNATVNETVFPSEEIYNDDVAVSFGEELYKCEIIKPAVGDSRSVQSYLDCLMPPGVGSGLSVKVVIRNATYRALLEGCTEDMKKWGEDTWPPVGLEAGGLPFGNCFAPSNVSDEFVVAKDYGITFTYDVPVITRVEPSHGQNAPGLTANVTIVGANFGAVAREIYGRQCRGLSTETCRMLFDNSVVLFNTSCSDINVRDGSEVTGQDVETKALNAKLAWCNQPAGYVLSCTRAFSEETSGCKERPLNICPDKFFGCGRRCPEDKIVCTVPVLGGVQKISVKIGGVTSTMNVSFAYDPPVLFSVVPPEVLAGSSSLITITGRNFGDNMAVRYAGRVINLVEGEFLPEIVTRYSPDLTKNVSSILWWDDAEYSTCFSSAVGVDPAKTAVMQRQCDAGNVPSSRILLKNDVTVFGLKAQQMVVQGPSAQAAEGSTILEVDIMTQVMNQRSQLSTENSTFSFRVGCDSKGLMLGTKIMMWHLAVDKGEYTSLSSSPVVSYHDRMVLLGGASVVSTEGNEIWWSYFTGTGWRAQTADRLWWEGRYNTTAVVFRDILFIMGGASRSADKAFNDIWIYADSKAVDDFYWGPAAGVDSPNIVAGQAYEPYWLRVSTGAAWPARSRAQAVEFNNYLYLIGGVSYEGEWYGDLWRSKDGVNWVLVKLKNLWVGRNNIFAVAHTNVNKGIWVVGSVQEQFYNTMYSEDGVTFKHPENACALINVDVQALVSWRGYLFLFTTGCHDYKDNQEKPRKCLGPGDPLHNRVWYTQNGQSWLMAKRPFAVDDALRSVDGRYLWSGRIDGEFRFDFRVVVHHDTLYIVGGGMRKVQIDQNGALVTRPGGGYAYVFTKVNDVHVCKVFMEASYACNDKNDQGLTPSQIMDRTSGTGNVPCTFRNNIIRRRGEEGEPADGDDADPPREEGGAAWETSGVEVDGRVGGEGGGMSDEALAELIKIYSAEGKPPSQLSDEGESEGRGGGGGEEEEEEEEEEEDNE